MQAANGIEFEEGTLFAPGVKIISANHDLRDLSCSLKAKPIKIGKYCWIGANAVILPETELGDYIVVGAGAIVTKSFPPYTMVAGNPAKIIGYRCKKCKGKMEKNANEKYFCKACKNIERDVF
jgi:acetyltransferase-like isoleucine patch superfamily enzyme